MPETPEVETEKLHEAIHEELEKEGSGFLRAVALTTAFLAALAAIAALQAGGTANEALLRKTESAQLQAEASDQWAYYQSKGIKAAVARGSAANWQALGKTPPAEIEATADRYEGEQKTIQGKARELEHERDLRSRESEELLHHHHLFANAVALFQVAISLGAMSAMTRIRLLWFASILLGLAGLVLFGLPLVR